VRSIPRADVAFAVLLTIAGLLESPREGVQTASSATMAALALMVGAVMLLRTLQPLVCLGFLVALVWVSEMPGTGLASTGALVWQLPAGLGLSWQTMSRQVQRSSGRSRRHCLHGRVGLRFAALGRRRVAPHVQCRVGSRAGRRTHPVIV
jgi:hypothetical protein